MGRIPSAGSAIVVVCCLAGAVVGIVGLGFGLTKLDPGFGKVLKETVIKVATLPLPVL